MKNMMYAVAFAAFFIASPASAQSLNNPPSGGGTNTNAGTLCSGSTTYLDGEGNCDDISGVYEDELNNSAGLLGALSDETGTGVAVFSTSPTFTTGVTLPTGSVDSTEILDGTILEADLKAVDAPSDEECLTYESTGGDFEWQSCGAGAQTITLTGDVTGSGTGSFAATITADSVALTTDTTGNYVATVAAGSGITVAGSDAEGATKTVTATLGTAIDSAEITDGVILEADLKVVDSPADEECLTYESTGGDFEWQACGGGGGGSPTQEFFTSCLYSSGGYAYQDDWGTCSVSQLYDTTYMHFFVPADFSSITNAVILVIPRLTDSAVDWNIHANYGALGQNYKIHDEADASTTYNVVFNTLFEIDISGILTSLAAGDYVGIKFISYDAAHDAHVIGLRFKY